MTGLKRLSKLRQYRSGDDLSEFMTTEHRQNMLALETSLNDLAKATMGCFVQFNALIIANNARSQLVLSTDFSIDTYGLIKNNTLVLQEDGSYEFDFSIFNLLVNSDRAIYLEVYANEILSFSVLLFSTDDNKIYQMSNSFTAWKSLKAKDVLSFYIYNDGFTSSNQASLDSVVLKMNKLKG